MAETPKDYILEQLKKFDRIIPYDEFSDLSVLIAHNFGMKLDEASNLIHSLRGDKEIGSQEYHSQGFGKNNLWPGQNDAHSFGMRAPGDLAEPKASLRPLSNIEILSYKVGDIVRVVNDTQAPWGASYVGVIEQLNAQNTADIRDLKTNQLYVNQPLNLLRNPLGEGRPDVRVQQRRVGDPPGLGESHLDSGDPNTRREYPGMYMVPRGQEGNDVKNPQSLFYKEGQSADSLRSFLLEKVVEEYGDASAHELQSYLAGDIAHPSRRLQSILYQYNITKESMLNVKKALDEVRGKSVEQINAETAWTWGSRAAACYQLASEASNEAEKDKWLMLADDYRHESLEHAALVEDEGKLVGEVSRALNPFRKTANENRSGAAR